MITPALISPRIERSIPDSSCSGDIGDVRLTCNRCLLAHETDGVTDTLHHVTIPKTQSRGRRDTTSGFPLS